MTLFHYPIFLNEMENLEEILSWAIAQGNLKVEMQEWDPLNQSETSFTENFKNGLSKIFKAN